MNARKREKTLLWSYAQLIEQPEISTDERHPLYWSQSRIYSPAIHEWLSVDPAVLWNPKSLLNQPGNWAAVRYAGNRPMEMVDPSGEAPGDVWLYRSDGSLAARVVKILSPIVDGSQKGPYTHSSVEINSSRQFTAHGFSAHVIDKNSDILFNLNKNIPRVIDIYRHKDGGKFNGDMATQYAEWKSNILSTKSWLEGHGTSSTYLFDGVCSDATRSGLEAGGLHIDSYGVFTTPNGFSRDHHFSWVGSYDTGGQLSTGTSFPFTF